MAYTFDNNTYIEFGVGKVEALKDFPLPGKKAMIVTTEDGFAAKYGQLAKVQELLAAAGKDNVVFDKAEPNPLEPTIMKGVEFARQNDVDLVVGLGGGSSMDAACVIAGMIPNEGRAWDYVREGTGGKKQLGPTHVPHVQITTNAGTGSEVDGFGVIQNPETCEKVCFFNEHAKLAIIDPELALTVPADYTAWQGFDAFFHNAEAYIGKLHNELSDTINLKAVRKVGQNIVRAVKNGDDLEARTNMSFASTMGGWSMELAGGVSQHSLEHAMSGYHHAVPHGAGLIMVSLAYFGHFIDVHACDDRFVDLAIALGKEDATKASDFLVVLEDLYEQCGCNDLKMSDYGFTPDEFPKLNAMARVVMDMSFTLDPVPLSDEDVVNIFEKSYR